MAQLPASHGSWVPRSGCKCVGSGTWHVQPESFTFVRRPRSDSAILCLPEIRCTGRRGRVRRRARPRPARLEQGILEVYRCATEYVKYAHESSVNKYKSARIQTQDTAQKCSCCFPTHVCQSLHQTARDTQDRGAQAACFADSTTADASVSAQGGF